MFGNGVSDEEIFMARLSRRLDGAYPEASWELVNTAVAGISTPACCAGEGSPGQLRPKGS